MFSNSEIWSVLQGSLQITPIAVPFSTLDFTNACRYFYMTSCQVVPVVSELLQTKSVLSIAVSGSQRYFDFYFESVSL